MRELTFSEANKMKEISVRLRTLSSPVLRLQALLQFSQIVDVLALGDTGAERTKELIREADYWNEEYSKLAEKCGLVESDE